MKLSIIIPTYNEERTIKKILDKVRKVDIGKIEKEIIVVDDASTDSTKDALLKESNIKAMFHSKNMGKGKAIRTGLKHATGDILIIQDADLEYDPQDYPKLLKPILDKECSVVYGSRFKSPKGNLKKSHLTFFVHAIGNFTLTLSTNILYSAKLTDMETCYKVFTKEALVKIGPLRARRFDFEPELTAKFLKNRFKIMEVQINYFSRDFHEGKKITWRDGLKALFYLIKYRFSD